MDHLRITTFYNYSYICAGSSFSRFGNSGSHKMVGDRDKMPCSPDINIRLLHEMHAYHCYYHWPAVEEWPPHFCLLQINAPRILDRFITHYFNLAASNQRIRERYGNGVIDIPGHETVLRPKETLQRLCDHLGVTCSEDYFEKCSKLMYGTPSVTRDKVVWSDEQIKRVTEMMKSYPFLKDYSYDGYPSWKCFIFPFSWNLFS